MRADDLYAVMILLAAAFALGVLAARSVARARIRDRVVDAPSVRSVSLPWRRVLPVVAAAVAGTALGGLPVGAIGVLAVLGWGAVTRRREGAKHAIRRDEQLADAVGAIVSALRAGMSQAQALAYAAAETGPPLSDSLQACVEKIGVGEPLDAAVNNWADEIASEDAHLIASVIELHHRIGGDLPMVLDRVAGAIRERVAVAAEVRAYTAQARLSGLILGLLPVGFFAFLWLTSRAEIQAALATPAGLAAVLFGLVLESLAFLWIRKLLAVA